MLRHLPIREKEVQGWDGDRPLFIGGDLVIGGHLSQEEEMLVDELVVKDETAKRIRSDDRLMIDGELLGRREPFVGKEEFFQIGGVRAELEVIGRLGQGMGQGKQRQVGDSIPVVVIIEEDADPLMGREGKFVR